MYQLAILINLVSLWIFFCISANFYEKKRENRKDFEQSARFLEKTRDTQGFQESAKFLNKAQSFERSLRSPKFFNKAQRFGQSERSAKILNKAQRFWVKRKKCKDFWQSASSAKISNKAQCFLAKQFSQVCNKIPYATSSEGIPIIWFRRTKMAKIILISFVSPLSYLWKKYFFN
jgi:hypothetical protein